MNSLMFAFASVLCISTASALPPFELFPADVDIRIATGEEAAASPEPQIVCVPGAEWLRLDLAGSELPPGWMLRITSTEDGASQSLDAHSLAVWSSKSAFFNGDTVDVELQPPAGTIYSPPARAVVSRVAAGLPGPHPALRTVCGNDDRVPSSDARIGRLVLDPFDPQVPFIDPRPSCTGWITVTGALLTAGHCYDAPPVPQVIEFNVPQNDANGNHNWSHPNDQYLVRINRVVWNYPNDVGQDWAVFDVAPNTNTGLLPAQAQGAFFRLSYDLNPSMIRITGYGTDTEAVRDNTQQTDVGPRLNGGPNCDSATDCWWEYQTDTETGNSGGPIIDAGSNLSIGIHTNGGCDSNDGNRGTSFLNDALEAAIAGFFGNPTVFVDASTPIGVHNGTAFRPYRSFVEAWHSLPSDGRLSIAPGIYPIVGEIVLNRDATITAPVGPVTIGQ